MAFKWFQKDDAPRSSLSSFDAQISKLESQLRSANQTHASDSLQNLITGMGNPNYDKSMASTYPPPVRMSMDDANSAFRQSWVCKKIVKTPADDMTREWVTHHFPDDDDESGAKMMADQETRFDLPRKVRNALYWARLYGGSAILIGISGDADLSQPLDIHGIKKGQLGYLTVFDRWRLSSYTKLTEDLNSPNFGLPDVYMLTNSLMAGQSGIPIHWTRLIRFDGEKLPVQAWLQNAFWDDSVLQHMMGNIKAYDQVIGGIAAMVWDANIDVVKIPDLPEQLASAEGEANLIKRFGLANLLKNFSRMLLLGGDEDYEKKSNTFSGLDSVYKNVQTDICGAADMPSTRFFGSSAKGMNATGEGDLRNYYDMLASLQNSDLRPNLAKLFEVLQRDATGSYSPQYSFKFRPLWQIAGAEKAEIEFNNAQRDKIYLDEAVLTPANVARQLRDTGTYGTISDEDVTLLEELERAMPQRPQEPDDMSDPAALKTKPIKNAKSDTAGA